MKEGVKIKMFFIDDKDRYGPPEVSKIKDFKEYLKQWPYIDLDLHPLTFQELALRLIIVIDENLTPLKSYLEYIAQVLLLSKEQKQIEEMYFCWYNSEWRQPKSKDEKIIRIPPLPETLVPKFSFKEIDAEDTLKELEKINENRLQEAEKILEDNHDNRYRMKNFDPLKDGWLYRAITKIYTERVDEIEKEVEQIKYFLAEIKKLVPNKKEEK